jgi:hypothetical protein
VTAGQAFGVELDADFAIPGLLPLPSAAAGRSSLRLASLTDVLAAWPTDGERLAAPREVDGRELGWWERHASAGYLVGSEGYGTFLVDAAGSSVRCAPDDGVEPWKWQRLLVGQVAPLLAVLHGHEVFHAAVVERDGRAVAIIGASGAGKSTLAAGLVSGGWRYLADDVLAIRPPGVLAQPGFALTSLRLDAATVAFGEEIGRDDVEGARLLIDLCPQPTPLAALLILRRDPGATGTTVERQDPVDPRLLLAAGYNFVVPDRERWLRQLDVCSAIAATVGVHTVTIGPDATPAATVAALEAALR